MLTYKKNLFSPKQVRKLAEWSDFKGGKRKEFESLMLEYGRGWYNLTYNPKRVKDKDAGAAKRTETVAVEFFRKLDDGEKRTIMLSAALISDEERANKYSVFFGYAKKAKDLLNEVKKFETLSETPR